MFVMALYVTTILLAAFSGGLALHGFWLGVTAVFCIERFMTLRRKGVMHALAAATIVAELPYDLFLLATYARAYGLALLGRRGSNW